MVIPLEDPVSIDVALASISDEVRIAMTDDGGMWLPALPLNTIGQMQPGEGYMIITEEDLTFTYNAVGMRNSSLYAENRRPVQDASVTPTGLPYGIVVQLSQELMAQHPAVIEIYDGKLLTGRTTVSDLNPVPLVAWKGDAELGLEGFTPGHEVEMMVYSETGEQIPVGVTDGIHHYEEDFFTVMNLTTLDETMPLEFAVSKAFPNPFNPVTTVRYTVPENGGIELTVFNILGQSVFSRIQVVQAGNHTLTLNSADFSGGGSSGMYFLNIRYREQNVVRKLVLLK